MRRYTGGGAFALFFHPHPGYLPPKTKKVLMPGGYPGGGGGWAQLELTDALFENQMINMQMKTTVG